jgi:hypothetical protein
MSPRGLFAPCLEFTNESLPLEALLRHKKTWLLRAAVCNKNTPCFYGCTREIGILWREKWRILAHFPGIVKQLFKYGNFF